MKEYGNNVQRLVDYIIALPDRQQRTKYAHILVELMRQIHPNMREGQDYSKKLWDDLYIMANFDLDVDSPYPAPPKEILGKKPMLVPYNQHRLKHRYYGRNVELLILKALLTENEGERKAFVSYIVKQMKAFYQTWNKDTIETEVCFNQILELSDYKLQNEVNALRSEGLIDSSPRDGNGNRPKAQQQGGSRTDSYTRNDFGRNDNQNRRNFGGSGSSNNNRNNNGRNNNNRNNTKRR
jgi:Domain of unknown function (DUF4290)